MKKLFHHVFIFFFLSGKGSFLSVDPLHEFNVLAAFVGNDPIQKVDRNGKGWESAVSVNMQHYYIEIDYSNMLQKSQMSYSVAKKSFELDLNQYPARARSLKNTYSSEFRVSIPTRFGKALHSSAFFLKAHNISNCSSFVLGTNEKGFLITTKSTSLPILEQPEIFDPVIQRPQKSIDVLYPAKRNDIVAEFVASGDSDNPTYFHTVKITHDAPQFAVANYIEKNQLQGKPSVDSYRNNQSRIIKPFRPKSIPHELPAPSRSKWSRYSRFFSFK